MFGGLRSLDVWWIETVGCLVDSDRWMFGGLRPLDV